MGKFILNKKINGEFRFNLVADNGVPILSSKAFSTKTSCLKGIELAKEGAKEDSNFERSKTSKGKHYFNLKAINGHEIARSELYDTEANREKGIALVKGSAPLAKVEEEIIKEIQKVEPEVITAKKYENKDEFVDKPKKNNKQRSHYS